MKPKNLNGFISRDRKELSEIDYMDQLSPEEQKWMNQFLEEEYNANFKKDGTAFHKEKEAQRNLGKLKKRRERSLENAFISSDGEKGPPDQFGTQALSPKLNRKKYPKRPPRAPVIAPGNPTTNETLEQFLARGGKIKKK